MIFTLICAIPCALFGGSPTTEDIPACDVAPGAFSKEYLCPRELRHGCVTIRGVTEETLRKQLADDEADPPEKLTAARALWRGRSRRYASDVLKFADGPPLGGEDYRAFQREVKAALKPDAVRCELRERDYLWGAWLAFLHPSKEFVTELIAALKAKPEMLSETILALGNSGDPRAVEPLIELLKSKDYWIPGDAAQALGYLGSQESEPQLIEALAQGNGWRQVKACGALARIGTKRSLSALEKLAADDRYTGALNIKGMAKDAIKRINKREMR